MADKVAQDLIDQGLFEQDQAVENQAVEDRAAVRNMVENASLMRSTLLNKLIDPRRDIDQECGYPKTLTTEQYRVMYDREGIAARVVSLMPEECWGQDPEIQEDEDSKETQFEKAWKELERVNRCWSYMSKADELSGIGCFGILLLGLDDGEEMSQPVEGISSTGEKVGNTTRKLLYLRAFGEDALTVKEVEQDRLNPRFGHPTVYSIKFDTIANAKTDTGEISRTGSEETVVHWTRIIHLADNRESSEVYGVPRMQKVFNRLYDIRKTAGGSGEMFWKGGFPGYSFEMDPNARPLTTVQKTELRTELAAYADGLQRYLAIQGVTAKSLTPQVANPKSHLDAQLDLIAISLGVPKRVFMGSEQGELASSQDARSWARRVTRRREKYLTPYVIRPFIDRMMAFGVLPEVKDYTVEWPDTTAPSDLDMAMVIQTQTETLAKYVQGGVDQLVPPEIYLTQIVGMDPEEVLEIIKAVEEREAELAVEEEEIMKAEEERMKAEEAAQIPPAPVVPAPKPAVPVTKAGV